MPEERDPLDQPITIPDSLETDNQEPEAKPKRRRGRPPTAQRLTVDGPTPEPKKIPVEEPEPEPEPKRRTGRATRGKVTPELITRVTCASFSIVAAVRQRPYWNVAPAETESFNEAAAELLNSLSPQAARQLAKASNGITVAIGLGSLVVSRVVQEQQEKAALQAATNMFMPSPDGQTVGEMPDMGEIFNLFAQQAAANGTV